MITDSHIAAAVLVALGQLRAITDPDAPIVMGQVEADLLARIADTATTIATSITERKTINR